MYIKREEIKNCIQNWYESMGVDTHGVWNKQLVEIIKEKDDDELRLCFHDLLTSIEELPSADAVSREDYHNLLTASNDIDRALREYQAKEENPSADAEQGEWLEIEDYNGDYHYQCSVCKDEFYLEYGTPKENGYAYCPSCGARMVKGGGTE